MPAATRLPCDGHRAAPGGVGGRAGPGRGTAVERSCAGCGGSLGRGGEGQVGAGWGWAGHVVVGRELDRCERSLLGWALWWGPMPVLDSRCALAVLALAEAAQCFQPPPPPPPASLLCSSLCVYLSAPVLCSLFVILLSLSFFLTSSAGSFCWRLFPTIISRPESGAVGLITITILSCCAPPSL